jgi:hypothetical protein
MGSTPAYARCATVGDRVHGLSIAWHLAGELIAHPVSV